MRIPTEFDEFTIEKLFGFNGVQMLIIDAILANGDRHAGNFGWLRSVNTGEYIKMAPLYDFDHVLDSQLESDRLLIDTVKVVKTQPGYVKEAIRISGIILRLQSIPNIFKLRASKMMSYLN